MTSVFQKTYYMYLFQKIDRDKLDVSYFESVSSSKSAYFAIEADNIHNLVENQILGIRDSDGNLNLFFGLTVNVGGLPLYKSSPSDIWPILIAVNNLDLVLPNVVLNIGKKKLISFLIRTHLLKKFLFSNLKLFTTEEVEVVGSSCRRGYGELLSRRTRPWRLDIRRPHFARYRAYSF